MTIQLTTQLATALSAMSSEDLSGVISAASAVDLGRLSAFAPESMDLSEIQRQIAAYTPTQICEKVHRAATAELNSRDSVRTVPEIVAGLTDAGFETFVSLFEAGDYNALRGYASSAEVDLALASGDLNAIDAVRNAIAERSVVADVDIPDVVASAMDDIVEEMNSMASFDAQIESAFQSLPADILAAISARLATIDPAEFVLFCREFVVSMRESK